jgi:hypothetical protein
MSPGSRFCPACGSAAPFSSKATTRTTPSDAPAPLSAGSTPDEGRFPPGTVLAQRYRISGRIGMGGMGEVYKATDLLLAQTVALKVLPQAFAGNEQLLERFRGELRLARQISHPSVCRVYDMGEAGGTPYLSMEYVDGEDLESLLRRIGRLPGDKALDIARQLCAGLAAAHAKGVIHRDLKPANIMLDGRGHVRIMDFGLAGFADRLEDARSGTPAYMAPEQIAGEEVTARSDIYALGLVLHELFTGKRPEQGGGPEIDPAAEQVIQRCLEADPRKRPASALKVLAALPGGDPLAAALAAGEIPSPELVANSGEVEGLHVPLAAACLAAVIVAVIALCLVRDHTDIVNHIPMDRSPDVLEAKAREIARTLGYQQRPLDTARGWSYDVGFIDYARTRSDSRALWARMKNDQPPALYFWYRESPQYLYTTRGHAEDPLTLEDPPPYAPGMVGLTMDTEGRLLRFDARPPATHSPSDPPVVPDWTPLLAAAGLDPASLKPAPRTTTAPAAFDAEMAWTAPCPGPVEGDLRVEAAAYQGRTVYFRVLWPWQSAAPPPSPPRWLGAALFTFLVTVPAAAFAWRNARLGRGDRRGAWRLATFMFVLAFGDLLRASHRPTPLEAGLIWFTLRQALFLAASTWVAYMAVEPYLRRRWSVALVSWSRLLGGRLRDPLVGAHVLVGVALAAVFSVAQWAAGILAPFALVTRPTLHADLLTSFSVGTTGTLFDAVFRGISLVFVLSVLRRLTRRPWIAGLLFVAAGIALALPAPGPGRLLLTALLAVHLALMLYLVSRFGLVALIAYSFTAQVLAEFPLTLHLSAWYAAGGIMAMLIVVTLAFLAFRTTLAGRPLWTEQ